MAEKLLAIGIVGFFVAACGTSGGTDADGGGIGPIADGGGGGFFDGAGADSQQPFVNPLLDGGGNGDGSTVCSAQLCAQGQRCELVAGRATCLDNSCGDLNCVAPLVCEPVPVGSGNICVDASCTTDVQCDLDEYCDGTICQGDVCTGGAGRCSGTDLFVCDQNGGGEQNFSCVSPAHFVSSCDDSVASSVACTCEDDWDCPAYMACEGGSCTGSGLAPTCLLDPADFSTVLPEMETGFPWGSAAGSDQAVGSPFPASAQVVMPPLVVNLDDDNGDGLINELDFPEIVFSSFCDTDPESARYKTNGVLRAVNGGGPNKGADFFASCGAKNWRPGGSETCTCGEADLNPTASLAAGDLDNDGLPEIVAITEGTSNDNGSVRIYDRLGNILAESTQFNHEEQNPSPALANLDQQGLVEIIIGRYVLTLGKDGSGNFEFVDRFRGNDQIGRESQGPIACVADLVGDARPEVVAGSSVYRFPKAPPGAARPADCGTLDNTHPDYLEHQAFCISDLLTVWDGQDVNGNTALPDSRDDGFCAVADVWGANPGAQPGAANPLDGVPEVVTVAGGYIHVFNGQTGDLLDAINLNAGGRGGAPNIDDFDGDGFPEIGTAAQSGYVMVDLQLPTAACPNWPNRFTDGVAGLQGNPARTPPGTACTTDASCGDATQFACNQQLGQCVCLHNGWSRTTQDASSRVTGSSVFDFNGDGAAEVIYNDECFFRVYDGLDGEVHLKEPAESRTRTEYPVVADVDNDGNAEIIFGASNESGFCDRFNSGADPFAGTYNAGVEVWGDDADTWVSARRIWNQHAYHVTNVTESGGIPTREPDSWGDYNGRTYNTYRSNPRSFGIAPDLTVTSVQLSSPAGGCAPLADMITITARVKNIGDVRVGPGVIIGFEGTWGGTTEPLYVDGASTPLTHTLATSLEPGGETVVNVTYAVVNNTANDVPDSVRVTADSGSDERECDETNNQLQVAAASSNAAADLRVSLGSVNTAACPNPTVNITVHNDGALAASGVVVRFYAGDPFAGGKPIQDAVIAGTIAPGGSTNVTVTLASGSLATSITLHAVVNPDRTIAECAEGNNTDQLGMTISCGVILL